MISTQHETEPFHLVTDRGRGWWKERWASAFHGPRRTRHRPWAAYYSSSLKTLSANCKWEDVKLSRTVDYFYDIGNWKVDKHHGLWLKNSPDPVSQNCNACSLLETTCRKAKTVHAKSGVHWSGKVVVGGVGGGVLTGFGRKHDCGRGVTWACVSQVKRCGRGSAPDVDLHFFGRCNNNITCITMAFENSCEVLQVLVKL